MTSLDVDPDLDLPGPGDGIPERIATAIRERTGVVPEAGIVLGSGLGDSIRDANAAGASEGVEIAYAELPGFPQPSVEGHAGRLWVGELGGRPVAVFRGRIHYYEGHGMALASITSRVSAALGARTMMLTTAVGAVDRSLECGALVVVRDHINLMGVNPLMGWRMSDGSPAFVDISDVYDARLSRLAVEAARAHAGGRAGVEASTMTEGVYAAIAGPSFETGAEIEMMRRAGATVVGMSMVPEAVAARALDMRVLGLSFVTNEAGSSVSHEGVLVASQAASESIGRVLAGLVQDL